MEVEQLASGKTVTRRLQLSCRPQAGPEGAEVAQHMVEKRSEVAAAEVQGAEKVHLEGWEETTAAQAEKGEAEEAEEATEVKKEMVEVAAEAGGPEELESRPA